MSFAAYAVWRKSTYSGSQGTCVEITDSVGGLTRVRDSKLGDASPNLTFTRAQWQAFVVTLRK